MRPVSAASSSSAPAGSGCEGGVTAGGGGDGGCSSCDRAVDGVAAEHGAPVRVDPGAGPSGRWCGPGRKVRPHPGASSCPSSTRSTRPASTSGRTLSRRPRTCIGLGGAGGDARLPVGQLRCGRRGSGRWGRSRATCHRRLRCSSRHGRCADGCRTRVSIASGATPTARSRSSQPVPERRFQAGISGRSLCSPMQVSTRMVRPPTRRTKLLIESASRCGRGRRNPARASYARPEAARGRGSAGTRAATARNHCRRRSRRR